MAIYECGVRARMRCICATVRLLALKGIYNRNPTVICAPHAIGGFKTMATFSFYYEIK